MVTRTVWKAPEPGQLSRYVPVTSKGSKKITLPTARERLDDQLERLGAQNALLSTNLQLTTYGLPRADRAAPTDVGVAVYFQLKNKDRVLACDRWMTVAENIAAIANHIDAIRRVERYGVGTLDQAFAGYDALPAPGADNRPHWRKVFEIDEPSPHVTPAMVQIRYRAKARQVGGNEAALLQLNLAREDALKELGVSQ